MARARRFGFGAVFRRFRGISVVAGFGAGGAVAFGGGAGFGFGEDFPKGGSFLGGGFGASTR